jgi:transcriptional regulator with XRE-family HTH domain
MKLFDTPEERKGFTRREVALEVGVTEQTIFNIEHGVGMSVSLLNKLADKYECSTDTILGRPGGDAE